jgi:tetratricopeptide (TPR) repeat protein
MVRHEPRDRYFTGLLKQLADQSTWVFADRQMFAFRAGLLVPPELSVTSQKRMRTGSLSPEQVVQTLEDYAPEQIVFCGWRMDMTPAMRRFLNENYNSIYTDEYNVRRAQTGFYVRRGVQYDPMEVLEGALADSPDCKQAYCNLGLRMAALGDTDGAIENFGKALSIDPTYSRAIQNLGDTYLAFEQWAEGMKVYADGVGTALRKRRVDPNLLLTYARRLATCPEPQFRDGARAEKLASQAVSVLKRRGRVTPWALDVQAAAYAAAGRFDDARRTAEAAVRLAKSRKKEGTAQQIQRRLKLYQAKHAYQERVSRPRHR